VKITDAIELIFVLFKIVQKCFDIPTYRFHHSRYSGGYSSATEKL